MSLSDIAWLRQSFDAADRLGGEERAALLDLLSEERPELIGQLRRMLGVGDDDLAGLAGAIDRVAADYVSGPSEDAVAPPLNADLSGEQIGIYRLLSPIAQGGMGYVYLAERVDGAFEQQVALKVLGRAAMHRDAAARFRSERQILARLNHPNIARILDGGTASDGRMYLVMEYIDGEPIDQYCAARQLDVRAILGLFRQVCAAVDYAHRNLIVHRDLKPANILVDKRSTPKLLDFGIAKLISAAPEEESTVTANRLMTPAYASPEQILGSPVTTTSDVYSLGVLLYELLTQSRPRSLEGLKPSEIEHTLLHTRPTPPSEAVQLASARRARLLRGDIDDILLMALEGDAQDRYPSVAQFSADIELWLQGQPVRARRQSLVYVTRKFIRRNRLWVASAVCLVGIMVSAVSFHIAQINLERDRARLLADQKSAIADFLDILLTSTTPDVARGKTVTARTLLDAGINSLDGVLANQPGVRSSLLGTIGTAYRSLGYTDEAVRTLRRAVDLARDASSTESANSQERIALVERLTELGDALADTNAIDESLEVLQEAVQSARSQDAAAAIEAAARGKLAHVLHFNGEYQESVEHYERALELLSDQGDSVRGLRMANLNGLAQTLMFLDRNEEAISYARLAVAEAQSDGIDTADEIVFLHNLAAALEQVGEFAEAETLFLRVYALEKALLPADHVERDGTMITLGLLYLRTNRLDEAERFVREGLAQSMSTRGRVHRFTAYNRVILAKLLTAKKEFDVAREQFDEALAVYNEVLEPDHPYIGSAECGYAQLLLDAGQPQLAENRARKANEIFLEQLPTGHWLLAWSQGLIGEALLRQQRTELARPLIEEALDALAVAPGRVDEAARMRALLADMGPSPQAGKGQ